MTTYLIDPETKELIEKSDYEEKYGKVKYHRKGSVNIIDDIEPFQSHVDGSVIQNRKQLKEHNKRNGVTNASDYSESYYKTKGVELKAKAEGKTQEDTNDRKRILHDKLTKEGVK